MCCVMLTMVTKDPPKHEDKVLVSLRGPGHGDGSGHIDQGYGCSIMGHVTTLFPPGCCRVKS